MSAPTRPDRAILFAFAGVVLFGGLNTIAVKQTVAELAPEWGAAVRFIAAGVIFAALTLVRGRAFPRGRALAGAMLYGAVGFGLAFGFVYPALREVHAGTAAVVLALSPLATYGLAVAQRQEAFRPRALVGALVALAGVGLVFVEQLGAAVPIGALLMVALGMACLSEAGIIVKWVPRSDPFATNAVAMLTGGVLLLVASLALGEPQALPTRMSTWIALGYITVFGSVVMFGLYLYGLTRWSASAMSYSTLLLPFVSVTVATLLTGEDFSLAFFVGGLVMLAGVYVGAFGSGRPRPSTATSMPECLPVDDCAAAVPARRAIGPATEGSS
ncbi:MAG TPA: EamA family transporter [Candidatus Limnocylindrales bacterium]|nr:EamA family transporter [Candidatus Limnocylindrales bacterium]